MKSFKDFLGPEATKQQDAAEIARQKKHLADKAKEYYKKSIELKYGNGYGEVEMVRPYYFLSQIYKSENNDAEYLNLVVKQDEAHLRIAPDNLLPVIVKALQDLSKENKEMKNQLTELKNNVILENDISSSIHNIIYIYIYIKHNKRILFCFHI